MTRPTPSPRFRPLAIGLLLAQSLAACSGGAPAGPASPTPVSYPGWPDGRVVGRSELVPILVASDLAVGPNRFLLSLADDKNRLIAAPDLSVRLRFFDLATDPARPVSEARAAFLWSLEGKQGLYRAPVEFTRAGDWGVEVAASRAGEKERSARVVFPVRERSSTPAIGSPVPRSTTATAAHVGQLKAITTDERPDLAFYRLSVADAVASGRPSVIVFATPKFCSTRTCGPALDIVKSVAPPFRKDVNFVHVEVYSNLDQPDKLEVVPAVREWGLPTEPWIFVVDRGGVLRAKFEGVAGRDELVEAIEQVRG